MNRINVVVGVTGASGAPIAVRIVERLAETGQLAVHLVVSPSALRTLEHETGRGVLERMTVLATVNHAHDDIGASIASGSVPTAGMIVAPCSMRTLGAIAHSIGDNLIVRAADVHLKERRKLVLVARETPLHLGHLRTMGAVTEMGAIVMPPVPAFYHRPQSVEEIIDQIAARAIDLLGLPIPPLARAWNPDVESGRIRA